MAGEDLDFWVHYGDYVYVNDMPHAHARRLPGRVPALQGVPLLQHLHATYPVVAMWDDGEFANGMDRNFEPARFAAAAEAWFEHQPVRRKRPRPHPHPPGDRVGRPRHVPAARPRQYRDAAVPGVRGPDVLPFTTVDTRTPEGAQILDPGRTCLGAEQKRWLMNRLTRSEHTWRHVGHGYNFLALRLEDLDMPEIRADPPPGFHLNEGRYIEADAWDNYVAERREILGGLAEAQVPNVVVTAGHTHIWFAGGLRPDHDDLEGSPVVAHEFVCGPTDGRPRRPPHLPPRRAARRGRADHPLARGLVPRHRPGRQLPRLDQSGRRPARADLGRRHGRAPGHRHVRGRPPAQHPRHVDNPATPGPTSSMYLG